MARIEKVKQAGGMAEVVRPLKDVHKIFGVTWHLITSTQTKRHPKMLFESQRTLFEL